MWELAREEGWVLKNWCFQIVVLEKTLESPMDSKEIKSVLKEINPECSLEVLMLKLKLQYFGHLMQRTDSLKKTLTLGKTEGRRRRGQQRIRYGWITSPTLWTWVWVSSWSWWMDREAWRAVLHWNRKESDTTVWLNWLNRASNKIKYFESA